jgi:WD40 repeat protein
MKRVIVLFWALLTAIQIHAQEVNTPYIPAQVMELGRGTANAIDWDPSGSVLAVGGTRGLWLYDEMLADLAHFPEVGEVIRLAWAPNGEMLAIFSPDYQLNIWHFDRDPYRLRPDRSWSFDTNETGFPLLAWAPDSQRLAINLGTGAQVLDVVTGAELLNIPDLVYTLTWRDDGSQIAGMVDLGTEIGQQVRVWDAASGAVINTYISSDPNLFWSDIQWSPDSSVLVGITSIPAALYAWNVSTGELLNDAVASEFGAYFDMWWSDNGQELVTVSRSISSYRADSILDVWDTTTWTPIDHGYLVGTARYVAKRPDVNEWAVLTWDSQIMLWAIHGAEPLRSNSTHAQTARLLAWSPDNQRLASATKLGGSVYIWDVATPDQVEAHVATVPYVGWNLDELRWSANSDVLIGFQTIPEITAPGTIPTEFIVEWNTQTGEYMGTIHETPGYVARDGSGDYLPVYTWNNDFTRVVTTELADTPVTISTVLTNENGFMSPDEVVGTVDIEGDPYKLVWSPDSTLLAVISRDPQGETTAAAYDAETGALVNRLTPTFDMDLYDISWSPDSALVALVGRRGIAGSGETEYRLDIQKIDPALDEAVHITTVLDTATTFYHAWQPTSHAIAVTTSQGVGIYPITSLPIGIAATPLAVIPDVKAFALAWSPDGRWLAGGHEDGTVRVWDVTDVSR